MEINYKNIITYVVQNANKIAKNDRTPTKPFYYADNEGIWKVNGFSNGIHYELGAVCELLEAETFVMKIEKRVDLVGSEFYTSLKEAREARVNILTSLAEEELLIF